MGTSREICLGQKPRQTTVGDKRECRVSVHSFRYAGAELVALCKSSLLLGPKFLVKEGKNDHWEWHWKYRSEA